MRSGSRLDRGGLHSLEEEGGKDTQYGGLFGKRSSRYGLRKISAVSGVLNPQGAYARGIPQRLTQRVLRQGSGRCSISMGRRNQYAW